MTVGNTAAKQWHPIKNLDEVIRSADRPAIDVNASVVEDFQRDGVVLIPDIFKRWVPDLSAGLQRNLDDPQSFAFPCDSVGDKETGRFFDSYCNWQLISEYCDFVLSSPAASLASQLMRSTTAQLFHDHAFVKERGTQKATPWHHDLPYYCIDGFQTVSLYIALDPIPAQTAVRFLKGSHRNGHLYAPRNFASGAEYSHNDPSLCSAPHVEESASDLFIEALQPGDALCFDFRTLHGTTDEPIQERRRAFSTRWMGDDVRYLERLSETSPPLNDLGLTTGDLMRTDLFPILWPTSDNGGARR